MSQTCDVMDCDVIVYILGKKRIYRPQGRCSRGEAILVEELISGRAPQMKIQQPPYMWVTYLRSQRTAMTLFKIACRH